MLNEDTQNGIERKEKNDYQHHGKKAQAQQPFENEFHFVESLNRESLHRLKLAWLFRFKIRDLTIHELTPARLPA